MISPPALSALILEQADIFGMPVGIQKNYEGSSIGAAILGLKGCGLIENCDDVATFIDVEKVFPPNEERTHLYNELFVKFKNMYQQLLPLF